MAVGEGEIASLHVAVGGNVQPVILPIRTLRDDSECGIPDVVLVCVNEDEQLSGTQYLIVFAEVVVRRTIRAVADVVAAFAQNGRKTAHGGTIGRAMINRGVL